MSKTKTIKSSFFTFWYFCKSLSHSLQPLQFLRTHVSLESLFFCTRRQGISFRTTAKCQKSFLHLAAFPFSIMKKRKIIATAQTSAVSRTGHKQQPPLLSNVKKRNTQLIDSLSRGIQSIKRRYIWGGRSHARWQLVSFSQPQKSTESSWAGLSPDYQECTCSSDQPDRRKRAVTWQLLRLLTFGWSMSKGFTCRCNKCGSPR